MKFRRAKAFVLATAVLFTTIAGGLGGTDVFAAAKKGYGTATVRILATTDMHGQSVKLNYDSGVEGEGSLAQIAGIIKRLRKSMKHGTTVTVDCGDNVYGIGSESIMTGTVSGAEYMYEEMAALGYDAITLGNHDFDYGVDYIKKALKTSDISNKVVLSNVVDAKTKKNLYKGSTMITKTVKTTTGKSRKIKIGFVGAVIPSLTSRTDGMTDDSDSDASAVSSLVTHVSWKGVIETKDIVSSVRTQAKALKKKGANIVVVLAHSGIGNEDYQEMDDNAGYALTEIPEVDAVCAGHTHMDFPADNAKAEPYYEYIGTDGDGLMNGKPLIEEKDHGASLGIADLKIAFTKWGTPYVKSSSSRIRKIKSTDPEDPEIVSINQKYDEQYQKIYDQAVTTVDHEADNYFGTIEDNPLVHLCNQAKIEYGLRAIKNLDDKYRNAPVIAATEYLLGGNDSSSNYIRVDGTVHVKDLLNLEAFNQQRAKVYYMTGAQLRESLEWQAARFYQTSGQEAAESWDSETKALVDQGMRPILSPQYNNGWKGYMVYDGVEYVINPAVAPRYDADGKLINDTHRITSLTRNGVPVSDTDIFVLVSKNISSTNNAPFSKYATSQLLVSKTAHLSSMLETYMKGQTIDGNLQMFSDGNWKVAFPESNNYIIKSSTAASEIARSKMWYQGEIPAANGYSFYKAALGTAAEQTDTSGPFLVASPMETQITGDPVRVRVEANDISGLGSVTYLSGIHKADDSAWYSAQSVTDNAFRVTSNGTYSVRAVDVYGNANVTYVTVNNIDTRVAVAPSIQKLTNRTLTINGKASPHATFHMAVSGSVYEATADEKGNFSFKIKAPNADDVAQFYQIDSQGRTSATVNKTVERTGANTPVVNAYANNSLTLTGTYVDDPLCRIMVKSGNNIYIPKDAQALYNESSLKTSSSKAVKCSYSCTNGQFSLKLPVSVTGTKYKVYGVDWIGRLSTTTSITTAEAAPNQPRLMSVVAEEGQVYGRIPSPTSENYTINVTTDSGQTYTGTAASDGHFGVQTDSLKPGTKVTVTATDVRDGVTRTSAAKNITAKTYSDYLDSFSGSADFDEPTDASTEITGSVSDGTPATEATLIINGIRQKITLGEDGTFTYPLETPLSYGDKLALVTRNEDHSMATVDAVTVKEELPEKPQITTEDITEDTTQIRIVGNRDCTAVLKSGSTIVKKESVAEHSDGFIYKITIPEKLRKKGKTCKVYLENTSGESDSVYFTVKAGKKKEVDSKKKK